MVLRQLFRAQIRFLVLVSEVIVEYSYMSLIRVPSRFHVVFFKNTGWHSLITNGTFLKCSKKSNNLHFYLAKKELTLIQNINTERLIDINYVGQQRTVLFSYLGFYMLWYFSNPQDVI